MSLLCKSITNLRFLTMDFKPQLLCLLFYILLVLNSYLVFLVYILYDLK